MKEDIEQQRRALESATDEEPAAEPLDPETAALRETWLAFGQLLDTALPPAASLQANDRRRLSPLAHSQHGRLPTFALLAASLLIVVATAWMLDNAARRGATKDPIAKTASHDRDVVVGPTNAQTPPADDPQWNDSLDDQFMQIAWQMVYIGQNRGTKTDAFGIAEYQVEQFRQTIDNEAL